MQKLLNIGELADFLGFTVAAVSAHLHRKNWDAVPKPIKLGRRLAWPVEEVQAWVRDKIQARDEQRGFSPSRVGRPRRM